MSTFRHVADVMKLLSARTASLQTMRFERQSATWAAAFLFYW